jgi:hypothetical protein
MRSQMTFFNEKIFQLLFQSFAIQIATIVTIKCSSLRMANWTSQIGFIYGFNSSLSKFMFQIA